MNMQKVNLLLAFALFCAAVVEGQIRRRPGSAMHKKCSLNFRNDVHSMFYWPGYENICTKSLCQTYPWLKCGVAKDYIMDQAMGHMPEDILMEIEYLKKYFNTMIPQPRNTLPYSCKGACQENARSLQLERVFVNIPTMNPNTYSMEPQRLMCIVIGPDIYYQQCEGKCKLPYGGSGDSYCVPDVVVTIDIWVFCPDAKPKKCHKIKFDLPLSCSCKKFRCKKDLPQIQPLPITPVLPMKPIDWDPINPGFPMDPKFLSEMEIGGPHGGPHGGPIGGPHGGPIGGPHGGLHGGPIGGPVQLGPVRIGAGQLSGLDPHGHK